MTDWDPAEHPRNPENGRFVEVGVPGVGGWIAAVAGRMVRGWNNDAQARDELKAIAAAPDRRHYVEYEPNEGQSAHTTRVDLPDGRSVIRKEFGEIEGIIDEDDEEQDDWDWGYGPEHVAMAKAEAAVARVAEAIGAPVPPAVWDGNATVWMGFVDGASGWEHNDAEYRVDRLAAIYGAMDPTRGKGRDAWLLGLLDLLVANDDRHPGNWIETEDRIYGIDHAAASLYSGRTADVELPGEASHLSPTGPFARLFFDDDRGSNLVPNQLHPDDIAAAREALRRLYGHARGGNPKLIYMLHVLDMLEPYARGTRRLIP